MSSEPSAWSRYVDTLDKRRSKEFEERPLRAMADEIVCRSLEMLFPQLSRVVRTKSRDVKGDAQALEALLREALSTLVSAEEAEAAVFQYLEAFSRIHDALEDDAMAILAGDPAAESRDEVIQAYPGFLATAVHRVAHQLYVLDIPILPRVLSEWSHRETGIDIHPGATIGRSFAIDHGTGIVIGESSHIGNDVRIYQGVTLGALAVSKQLANKKRHPTIGNNVIIYANATILGGTTEVGDGSIIGGNVWLTHSVPARSIVQFSSRIEARNAEDDGMEFHI